MLVHRNSWRTVNANLGKFTKLGTPFCKKKLAHVESELGHLELETVSLAVLKRLKPGYNVEHQSKKDRSYRTDLRNVF